MLIKLVRKKGNKPVNGLKMGTISEKSNEVMAGCGFGLSDVSYQINEAYGSYMTKSLPRWIVVTDKEAVLKNLLPESTNPIILPELHSMDFSTSLKVAVDELNKNKWDEYYFNVFAPMTIGTQRDYRFLKWRYMESPVLRYRIITVYNDNYDCLGLAVFRREYVLDGKFALERIVEFISVRAEASIVLANALIKTFPDVIAWDFYCLSNITAYGLEAVGFRCIPDWMDYVMMPTRFQPIDYTHLKINGSVYLDEKIRFNVDQMTTIPWYITRGDADQDRAN